VREFPPKFSCEDIANKRVNNVERDRERERERERDWEEGGHTRASYLFNRCNNIARMNSLPESDVVVANTRREFQQLPCPPSRTRVINVRVKKRVLVNLPIPPGIIVLLLLREFAARTRPFPVLTSLIVRSFSLRRDSEVYVN